MNKNIRKQVMTGLFAATSMCTAITGLNKVDSTVYAANLKDNNVTVTKLEVVKHERIFEGNSDKISERYFGGVEEPKVGYTYIKGTKPILISVPHTVKQPARGEYDDGYGYKNADKYTGAIAKIISEKTGAHVIYKTATKAIYDDKAIDENYTTEMTPYRKKIMSVINTHDIKAVIDIHGFDDSKHDNVIEIGTGYGKNLLGKVEVLNATLEALDENGFKVDISEGKVEKENKVNVDVNFAASRNYTLSSYVSEKFNVPCLQIEIGSSYRNPGYMNKFNKTVNSLVDIIDNVSSLNISKSSEVTENYPIAKIVDVKKVANMRKSGNKDSDLIAKIKKGEYVMVIGNVKNSWVKVKYGNKTGYVYGKYLDFLDGTVKKTETVTSHIYLRSKANGDSEKIQKVKVGEKVDILGLSSDGKWYKVRYKKSNGDYITGYACTKYIKRG